VSEKTVVCFCLDVTEDDVRRAIADGFDHIETIKRYTGAMMGPCQGKMCRRSLTELYCALTGQSAESVVQPTSRPPMRPVRLGTLAGRERDDDQHIEPATPGRILS
jgi:bacterioferritin-associated ferredoxin